MPRGDRTGPMGMGVMSGRASGFCAGFGMPGYANSTSGRGYGMGFARGRGSWIREFGAAGRGWRHRYDVGGSSGRIDYGGYAVPAGYPTPYTKPDPELEKRTLKNQAEALQSELDVIKSRLAELENRNTAK